MKAVGSAMTEYARLTMMDELLLLALGEDGRLLRDLTMLGYALAGGVLMELAIRGRIDTDLDRLILLSTERLEDTILDEALMSIAEARKERDVRFWVEELANRSAGIREEVLSPLVGKGLIERRDRRFLGVFRSRRYAVTDEKVWLRIRQRVRNALLGEAIPEPRDITLTCLGDACRLLSEFVDEAELTRLRGRLETLRRLELVGLVTSRAIDDIRASLSVSLRR